MEKDKRLPVLHVYTGSDCPNCDAVEARLLAKDIPYDAECVENNPDAVADAIMEGFDMSMPLPWVHAVGMDTYKAEGILEGIDCSIC